MDNEDTMNLEDTDYMSGDELMDQNPDEDEAVAVEDTLMSTSENRRKRGGDEVDFEPLEEVGEEVKESGQVMNWTWNKIEEKMEEKITKELRLMLLYEPYGENRILNPEVTRTRKVIFVEKNPKSMRLEENDIHFGGSMKKIGDGEDYEYLGELGSKNVDWKTDDIVWDMLVDFCKEEALIRAPLGLIWCNSEKEEMKELRYVYDRYDGEMCQLRSTSKSEIDVVEVFVEHECSEHIPGVIQLSDTNRDDAECGDEEEEHSENDVVDRPKEDDEPEESEDEKPAENETGEEDNPTVNPLNNEGVRNENLNDNEDDDDEDDGARDVRFQSVFQEGQKTVPDKEAYGIEEEEKDDDSEDERARWDLTGIPCKLDVCVLDDNKEDHVKYIAEYYYTHVMKRTYSNNIKPVNGESLWKKTDKPPIGISEIRKPRGRPRTRDRKK
ncbi:hypothetical protein F2Q70_00009288 [Brassica cretica]|uniref:Uncharacterized protein n=1 Tax=Brassica cretica TaxID=69181 RepID=A0A8S9M459_BRACR|nr:hypothetical protein F2Q70_00009288 [Brassica cretica]